MSGRVTTPPVHHAFGPNIETAVRVIGRALLSQASHCPSSQHRPSATRRADGGDGVTAGDQQAHGPNLGIALGVIVVCVLSNACHCPPMDFVQTVKNEATPHGQQNKHPNRGLHVRLFHAHTDLTSNLHPRDVLLISVVFKHPSLLS